MSTKLKSLSFADIRTNLINKRVHLTATCELFPNFDLVGTVHNIYLRGGVEIMLKVKSEKSGKMIDVSGNMKGLAFDIL